MRLMTTPSLAVVNRDELINRMMGSIPMAERLLKRFVETASQDIELLESTVRLGDQQAIASLAHRHKGTARTIAAPRVAECAAKLEACTSTNSTADLLGILDELRKFHNEVRLVQQAGLVNPTQDVTISPDVEASL
ncbi:Hpt domain protein [Novipirellula aureliae]|uniref:Hpt domain protein n=1 Tax=Novipirellula aureliae TaxID=2527966 RepID=A0A5C6DD73_9BACT|nr:Hpt domain-containing protein [Novipirellula aureliae]TWU33176.1 Hpt domain protein [Novipirellula aureliae]